LNSDEEDAIGEILGGEQCALAEGLLAEIEQAGVTEGGRSTFKNKNIIL